MERPNETLPARIARRLDAFAHRKAHTRGRKRAAVAIPVIVQDETPTFLLTRRAPRLSSHGGQWAFPGGRIDAGETPERAALREMHEEVGLNLAEDAVLGRLDDYPTRSGYVITPIVVWAGADPALVPNPGEVASLHHFPLAVFDHSDTVQFESIPESDRPVLRLLLDARTHIHAPTAAMLWQFAEVALKGRATRVDHVEQPVFAWR